MFYNQNLKQQQQLYATLRSICCTTSPSKAMTIIIIMVLMNVLSISITIINTKSFISLVDAFSIGSNNYNNKIIQRSSSLKATNNVVSVCIIGGGVSGLTAAITAASSSASSASNNKDRNSIVVCEASSTLGGRVQSDVSDDGKFILDRGFAVFIEEYPYSKQLFNYNDLQLNKFLPGALVKIQDNVNTDTFERVADPIRQPLDLFTALFANVGTIADKIKILPLIYHVKTKTITEIFNEPETNTLIALQERWKFSNDMINKFFKPFLEGIYLAPLEEQSSRMFTFVFQMFTNGAATLPINGMGTITQQLVQKATANGVTVQTDHPITRITKEKSGLYKLQCMDGGKDIYAETVIVATDGPTAKKLLSTIDEIKKDVEKMDEPIQRSVGCLYYSFVGKSPIDEPILILNGEDTKRGTITHPVNNICFPSVVSRSYCCDNDKISNLCSVTILKDAMKIYENKDKELDIAVRNQLASWFPSYKDNIINEWKLQRIYKISNAQPSQLHGTQPANVNGGRSCNMYGNISLPFGLYVCGDHIATATLNGAIESGMNAGNAAVTYISQQQQEKEQQVLA